MKQELESANEQRHQDSLPRALEIVRLKDRQHLTFTMIGQMKGVPRQVAHKLYKRGKAHLEQNGGTV